MINKGRSGLVMQLCLFHPVTIDAVLQAFDYVSVPIVYTQVCNLGVPIMLIWL